MSKKKWGLKQAIISVFQLLGFIMDGLEEAGSQDPDEDIKAFLDGGYENELGALIFSSMLVESWETKVVNSQFLVDFVAMKAQRGLTMNEIQKIADLKGLSMEYLLSSDNFRETLDRLLGMFPCAKVTLIGMEPDERGSVPMVAGSAKNVIGWRRVEDGISKGEIIALVRFRE
jgi:hypothetical protein